MGSSAGSRALVNSRVFSQFATACRPFLLRAACRGVFPPSAIVASIGDGAQFRSGRDLAAWLGLTPLNRSSGGKERLGRITKKGDAYIRRLLVTGMTARIGALKRNPAAADPWASRIMERKPTRVATVAMANKTARIAWAVLTRGTDYRRAAA